MFDAKIGGGNRQEGPGTSCNSRKLESAFRKEKTYDEEMSKEQSSQRLKKAKIIWAINIKLIFMILSWCK